MINNKSRESLFKIHNGKIGNLKIKILDSLNVQYPGPKKNSYIKLYFPLANKELRDFNGCKCSFYGNILEYKKMQKYCPCSLFKFICIQGIPLPLFLRPYKVMPINTFKAHKNWGNISLAETTSLLLCANPSIKRRKVEK